MIVGTAQVTLVVRGSQSLKDKRQVVRAVVEQTRRQYHCAVAEVDTLDHRQRAVIGIACVSNSSAHADEVLAKAVDFMNSGRFDAELLEVHTELVHL